MGTNKPPRSLASAVAVPFALAVLLAGVAGCTPRDPAGTTRVPGTIQPGTSSSLLRVFVPTQVSLLDPIRIGDPSEFAILNSIFDSLFSKSPRGEVLPELATAWEAVDETTLRLTLRPNVLFQDGTALDAGAVKFNLDRALRDDLSNIKFRLYQVESVAVVDKLTVDIHLKPDIPAVAALLDALADRAGMIASPTAVQAVGSEAFTKRPVGAGMFRLFEWRPGEIARVRSWEGYWAPETRLLAGADFVAGDDPVMPFLAGDLDVAFPVEGSIEAIKSRSPDAQILIGPGTEYFFVVLNETLPPFDDVRVRKAANYAIDREGIARVFGSAIAAAAWQPLPPGALGHNPELDGLYSYDPKRARRLLAEAGYPNGGVRVHFVVGAQATIAVEQLEVVQQQMNEAGFDVEITLADLPTVLPRILGVGRDGCGIEHGGFILAKVTTTDPDVDFRDRFLADGSLNVACNEPAWIRPLVDEAAASTDRARRDQLYREISARAMEEALNGVYLYFRSRITVAHPYVRGINQPHSPYTFDMRNVYVTKDH